MKFTVYGEASHGRTYFQQGDSMPRTASKAAKCKSCGHDLQVPVGTLVYNVFRKAIGVVVEPTPGQGLDMVRVANVTGAHAGAVGSWYRTNVMVVTGHFHIDTRTAL